MSKNELEYQGNKKVDLLFPKPVNITLISNNHSQSIQLPTSADIVGPIGIWKIGKLAKNALRIQEIKNNNPHKALEISSNTPFRIGITYYKKNSGAHLTEYLNGINRVLIHPSNQGIITYYSNSDSTSGTDQNQGPGNNESNKSGTGQNQGSGNNESNKSETGQNQGSGNNESNKSETGQNQGSGNNESNKSGTGQNQGSGNNESNKSKTEQRKTRVREIDALRTELEHLQNKKFIDYLKDHQKDEESLNDQINYFLEEVDKLNNDISDKSKERERLSQDLVAKRQEVINLDNQINNLETNLDQLTEDAQTKLNNLKNIEALNSTNLNQLREDASNLEAKLRMNAQTARMLEDNVFIGGNLFSDLIQLIEEKIKELITQIGTAVEVKEQYNDKVNRAVNATDGTIIEEVPTDNF